MTSTEQLLKEFKTTFEKGGDPNPRSFLDQVEGTDRLELELLINRYLDEEAPVRALDEAALEAERSSEQGEIIAKLVSEPGPSDLLMARRLQDLDVTEVAERLLSETEVVDATDAETAKTAAYLRRLERGHMPRVSERVITSLKRILGVEFDVYFVAFSPGTSFRMSAPDDTATTEDIEISNALLAAYATPSQESSDRVDALFFGST